MDKMEKEQYESLVLAPIAPEIIRLALPSTASMMVSMIYNLVDAFFVGQLGTSAAAATGVLVSVNAAFQAFGFMLGHGAGTNVSVKLGEGDSNAANRFVSTSFFTAIFVSIPIMVGGLLFLEPLMRLLGSTDTVLPYAMEYGKYMFIAGPALAAQCVLNNVMRYEGKAFLSMFGLVSGGVLNMIGDPIFMFGMNLGITGAGLSTCLAQYASFFILLFMFLSGKTIAKLKFSAITHDLNDYALIVKNGFPSMIRNILMTFSSATLAICSSPYGDAALAAMTIVGRIAQVLTSVLMGVCQGFQPMASFNYGARKYARVRESMIFTFKLGEALMIVFGTIAIFFAEPLVQFFRDDPAVIAVGIDALKYQCIAVMIQPLSVVVSMVFQSIRWSGLASFMSMLRSGLCYIPVLLIAPRIFGIVGIQAAQLIADILAFIISVPLAIMFFRRVPADNERTPLDDRYDYTLEHGVVEHAD